MFGSNMSNAQYNAMSKWQRRLYWAAVAMAACTIGYVWFFY